MNSPWVPSTPGHQGQQGWLENSGRHQKGQTEESTISSKTGPQTREQIKGEDAFLMSLCLFGDLETIIDSLIHLEKRLHFIFPWDLNQFLFVWDIIPFAFLLKPCMGLHSIGDQNF